MSTVAVIGSGSWGVAFSQHLAEMGYKVKVWSFKEEEKDDLNNNRKSIYLPDLTIHENVYCSNDLDVRRLNGLKHEELKDFIKT